MNNRMTLVGTLIVALSAACPSVAAAQNPWRADPQASGQYYTPQPAPQVRPSLNVPKYAPLDGDVNGEDRGYAGYPQMGSMNAYPGLGYRPYGSGYGGALGYGASPYRGGLGYGNPGLGGGGYGPSNGLGMPFGGSGLWPGAGGGNGLGGPMSWSPFW
ncbi:MAG: hypothetical protein JKY27_02990 [Magnetovibrio sp.]|nr:hypothetical protein [Magnetovibrio sp.]